LGLSATNSVLHPAAEMNLLTEPPAFAFDTSGFVNGLTGHYRRAVFPGVWDAIGQAMEDGVIVSPSEVLEEIRRRGDIDLYDWANDRSTAFLPPDATWAPHFAEIQIHAPHWFTGTGSHDADPFVVALAKRQSLTVVTYEGKKFSGDPAKVSTLKRSMPHVCRAIGVKVADLTEVLEHLGVVL
jgi:hypothetical protein